MASVLTSTDHLKLQILEYIITKSVTERLYRSVCMSNISIDLVKELREKTQVGMMDCKKALVETDGDIEKAIDLLRKKGAAVAAKRAGNALTNGRIECFVTPDFKQGALVELGCETDFSANTEDMKKFAVKVAQEATKLNVCDTDTLLSSSKDISNSHNEILAKIAEKIEISKIALFSVKGDNGVVNAYIHPGSSVGILIELAVGDNAASKLEALKQAARDVCMHIAVTNPLCISPENLDPAILEKEKSIMMEQLKNSGKPANIVEKIMLGKVNKYYEDVCLTKQKYIKDDQLSVEQYLNQVGKQVGTAVSIKRFARFGIGGK